MKCISQLELAQLFGVNANKGKLNLANSQPFYPNSLANNASNTFSLPFDNLFYSDKGTIECQGKINKGEYVDSCRSNGETNTIDSRSNS